MKSYNQYVEELDAVAGEIYHQNNEPSHAIHVDGLDLDYGMTEGRLIYRPDITDQPAIDLTLRNSFRGVHRYSLARELKLVIVESPKPPLQKSEIRKPKEEDSILILESRELGEIAENEPYMIMTINGLRRLTSDVQMFKKRSLAYRRQRVNNSRESKFRGHTNEQSV